ncbi:MAG: hypothetical protein R3B96_07160 [Pirellulaceae bacterium]
MPSLGTISPTIIPAVGPTDGARMGCSAFVIGNAASASPWRYGMAETRFSRNGCLGCRGRGNHGEDVKEVYYHLDATPTHSYLKALYKYPQAEFLYTRLVWSYRESLATRAGIRTRGLRSL